MNLYERTLIRFGHTRGFASFGQKVLTPIDRRMRGRKYSISTLGTNFPLCYLTTTGRKSGEPRTVPLLCVETGDAVAVVGSNFGTAMPATDAQPTSSVQPRWLRN